MIDLLQFVQIFCLVVTLVFIHFLWLGLRRRRVPLSDWRPRVSVLVAARNEEANLRHCLSSLAAQDYAADKCEFIVIDDASMDGTGAIIAEWADRDGRFKLVSLKDAPLGTLGPKKRALKAGFDVSGGDVIMTTDADSVLPPNWIRGIIGCFDEQTAAVCGLIRFQKPLPFWGRLAAFEAGINAILNAAVIGLGGALSCFGSNFAYRRAAFIDVGGFDAGRRSLSGDDDLLLQKFRSSGKRILFCDRPELTVITHGPENRRAYWSRKRRHLSAGKRYSVHWILLAAIIYLCCFTTALLGISKLAGATPNWTFLIGWGILSVSLLLLYIRGTFRLKLQGFLSWAALSAVLFPIVFTFIQPLSLLPAPTWKGRT